MDLTVAEGIRKLYGDGLPQQLAMHSLSDYENL